MLVFAVERASDGPIQTYGDALWWAAETVTTAGVTRCTIGAYDIRSWFGEDGTTRSCAEAAVAKHISETAAKIRRDVMNKSWIGVGRGIMRRSPDEKRARQPFSPQICV